MRLICSSLRAFGLSFIEAHQYVEQMRMLVKSLVISLFGICLVACEDKAMVEKQNKQEKEIEALHAELKLVKVKLGSDESRERRNYSVELEEKEFEVERVKGRIDDLERELEQLEKEHQEAEKAFKDYRLKYPVG